MEETPQTPEALVKPKPSISVYLTFLIIALAAVVPVWFSKNGVPEGVTYAFYGLIGGIGVSFDIVNFKHTVAKLKAEAEKSE